MSDQRGVLFGQNLTQSDLQSYVSGNVNQDKVYGLPWDLFPPLNNESGYHEGIRPIIENSTIVLKYNQDKDVFGKAYEWLTKSGNTSLQTLINFLTSKQYDIRKQVQNQINGQKIKLYTNLVTKDNHSNIELEVNNQLTGRTNYMQEPIMKTLQDQQVQTLTGGSMNVGDIERIFGGIGDFMNKVFSTMPESEQKNQVQTSMGYSMMLMNLMRLLTREGIKLWSGGELRLTTKFTFTFRQVSPETLDQVYAPVFYLLLQATPYQTYVGYDGEDQAKLQLTVTEKAPSLDLELYQGNGILYFEHQQISSLNIEFYDMKPVSNSQTIPNVLKGKFSYIPTQQDVTVTFENLLPLQFIVDVIKQITPPVSYKNMYPQLPKQIVS